VTPESITQFGLPNVEPGNIIALNLVTKEVTIMAYHFRNLIFEGGGVKDIVYVGALQVLEEKGILPEITRVGGTSAGAINAVLLGLNFTHQETLRILNKLDFKKLSIQ
jgi:predicted acylesterase/phospholipase RssA